MFMVYIVEFQLMPGVKVVIANPETKGQCADSHLGEVSLLKCSFGCFLNFNSFKGLC